MIFEQPDRGSDELGPQGGVDYDGMEVRGVGPATDRKQDLEMTVCLFQLVDCLEVTVQVLPTVVPRVTRIVDVGVRPCIGEVNIATIGLDVRERI